MDEKINLKILEAIMHIAAGTKRQPRMWGGRVLDVLQNEESMSQQMLADIMGIRPQSLSEMLGKLEAQGMISRRPSERDRRVTLVSITEKGLKRDGLSVGRAEYAAKLLEGLSEEERALLLPMLEIIRLNCPEAPKGEGCGHSHHHRGRRHFPLPPESEGATDTAKAEEG